MQSDKVEKLFVDFILKGIGPNEERENNRNTKFNIAKKIIKNTITTEYPDFIPYVFTYGSFPLKTYLKEADIDITIILEDKNTHQILIDLSNDIINNILLLIKDSFENYNRDVKQSLFTDINIIYGDIILIKCQIQSISLDVSVNNFFGLFKILFMDYVFNQINNKFNNIKNDNNLPNSNKLIIFKRTILLIKAWCFYEGNLMGSNIGLMASYALEVLIIFMFNLYYKDINNEIDGFFYFFNLITNIDLDNNIISLFGLISNKEFHLKLFNYEKEKNLLYNEILNIPFWYINNEDKNKNKYNDYLIDLNDIKEFMKKIINSKIYLDSNFNKDEQYFKKLFQEKLLNILDPINSQNNLGKSINYHSFSKMKKAFEYMTKEINKINKIKELNDPFLYINSLLKLFNVSLSMNFIELFINYLNKPKIIVDSQLEENKKNSSILKVNKEDIKKFNKMFIYKKNESKNNDRNENNKKIELKNEGENGNKDIEEEEEEYETDEEEEEESDEEEEEKKNNNNDECKNINYFYGINEKEKINTKQKNNDIKYENFDIIINTEIFNKLLELSNNDESQFIFYEKLNNDTIEHYRELDNFMKKFKLI